MILWLARSLVVGVSYDLVLMLVGAFFAAVGVRFATANQGAELLPALIVFYFIFGAINYALVTRSYYESHAGGLATPGIEIILVAETIRGTLIVLSVLPLLMIMPKRTRERAAWTAVILFAIGGIVPLLYRANAFPGTLLIASGVEIFFQNFSTGIVAALALGRTGRLRP